MKIERGVVFEVVSCLVYDLYLVLFVVFAGLAEGYCGGSLGREGGRGVFYV